MKKVNLLIIISIIFSCSSENDNQENSEPCETPIIELSAITLEDATFSSTTSTIQVEYGIEGFTLGTGTTIDVSLNTFSITELEHFRSYDLYAKTICTTTESDWFGPLDFVTQCDTDSGIFDGNVTLTNQAEVDAFGALCYSGINGILAIGNTLNNNIVDLTPLININSLTSNIDSGIISIKGITASSLFGINIIEANNLNLNIIENNSLTDFSEANFSSDIQVLIVRGNANLISLEGLEEVNSISQHLSIENNDNLTSLNGLNNIESWKFSYFKGNQSLVNFQGLNSLETISDLWLVNTHFENFVGLESLININTEPGQLPAGSNTFVIYSNQFLQSFNGLENLNTIQKITAGIDYQDNSAKQNPLLSDFCALQNLYTNGTYEELNIANNAYNPTIQDIQNGNCSQ